MNLNRSLIGLIIGVVVALVWQLADGQTLLVVGLLAVAGFGIGWLFEHPQRVIEMLQRLER